MSTHACFRSHLEVAKEHEDRAHMCVEDAAAYRHQGLDTAGPGGASDGSLNGKTFGKAIRCAIAQQRLAVREYKEATRLRPRDAETRQRLAAAMAGLKGLRSASEATQPKPLRRFLAHYNLSIRYWDLGKAKQAIEEAEKACEELRRAGLHCGCAEHNRVIMERVHAANKDEHRRLVEAVQHSPEAIGPNYELGIHYFDKRMLLKADAQLKWTRERARARTSLQLVQHERRKSCCVQEKASLDFKNMGLWTEDAEQRKAQSMSNLLSDLDDDLRLVAGLRELWCVEEEAGKAEELQATGIRDGVRPHLLPCLNRRYSSDCRACDEWWSDLCQTTDVCLRPHSARRSCSQTRPHSAPQQRSTAYSQRPVSRGNATSRSRRPF